MRVIKRKEFEREGNDCMIYNTIYLIYNNGGYQLQIDTIYKGWCDDSSTSTCLLDSTNVKGLNNEIKKCLESHYIYHETFIVNKEDL